MQGLYLYCGRKMDSYIGEHQCITFIFESFNGFCCSFSCIWITRKTVKIELNGRKMKNSKNAHRTHPTLLILVVSRELLKCEASLANEFSLPRLVEVRTVKQKIWGSHLRYEPRFFFPERLCVKSCKIFAKLLSLIASFFLYYFLRSSSRRTYERRRLCSRYRLSVFSRLKTGKEYWLSVNLNFRHGFCFFFRNHL